MATETPTLKTSAVALAGLGAEYCAAVATASQEGAADFCRSALRLLPRIYITAMDIRERLRAEGLYDEDADAIFSVADEDTYDLYRLDLARLFGEYNTYLDAQVQDMQYSDTPVAVDLSEKLADIYQQMLDYAESIRQQPSDLWNEVLSHFSAIFDNFLSETLCDALRVVNMLYIKNVFQADE